MNASLVFRPACLSPSASMVARSFRESAMDRNQKEASVEELKRIFDASGSVVMAHYSGMTVAEMTNRRAKLR